MGKGKDGQWQPSQLGRQARGRRWGPSLLLLTSPGVLMPCAPLFQTLPQHGHLHPLRPPDAQRNQGGRRAQSQLLPGGHRMRGRWVAVGLESRGRQGARTLFKPCYPQVLSHLLGPTHTSLPSLPPSFGQRWASATSVPTLESRASQWAAGTSTGMTLTASGSTSPMSRPGTTSCRCGAKGCERGQEWPWWFQPAAICTGGYMEAASSTHGLGHKARHEAEIPTWASGEKCRAGHPETGSSALRLREMVGWQVGGTSPPDSQSWPCCNSYAAAAPTLWPSPLVALDAVPLPPPLLLPRW